MSHFRTPLERVIVCRLIAQSLIVSALAANVALASEGPPVALIEPVTDSYFGTTVTDNYRWMETETDPRLSAFMKAENDYTRTVLDRIPGRDALAKRVEDLSNASTSVFSVSEAGGLVFYEKQAPGDETPKVYVRQGFSGKERLLLDPNSGSAKNGHLTIDWFAPSLNGRYVAFGMSKGGSEDSVLGVVESATGRKLAEHIESARFGVTTWFPDNKSFFYLRMQTLPPNAPPAEKYKNVRLYRHVLGVNPGGTRDEAVLGHNVAASVPVEETELAGLSYSPASPYLVAFVRRFVQNEIDIYVAPFAKYKGPATLWTKIAAEEDDVTSTDIHGDELYLLSHKDASRYKVLVLDLNHPDLASAKTLIPASDVVLRNVGVAKDGLYIQELDGGIGKLVRVPFRGDRVASQVPLPYAGAIGELSIDPTIPGALVKLTSWTEPQLWYRYDPTSGATRDTGLRKRSPVDFSNITSEEVKATASDGTLIPLSIIHRRDLAKDGSHATILQGYGAYGITLDPGFDPVSLAWLEKGGILAVAHVRGGGEYGEDWHLAGQKLTKLNTVTDLIACAQYLEKNGYTSTSHLAIQGGSAGGITVGLAMSLRPDLFAVVIDNVGVSDTLRVELAANGPTNIPEFGTVKDEAGFKGLAAMSPYLHVKDGTPYPAVMFTTGINDPRVAPWHMAKMAARVQAATSSGKPVLLRVDYDAGHGIGSTKSQYAQEAADEWAFILWQTGDPMFQPAP